METSSCIISDNAMCPEGSWLALATWLAVHLGKGSELVFILAKAESFDGELADHHIVTQHYGSGLFARNIHIANRTEAFVARFALTSNEQIAVQLCCNTKLIEIVLKISGTF